MSLQTAPRCSDALPAQDRLHGLDQGINELGFFCNQNTVCRPTAPEWNHFVERLKQVWGIE